MNTTEQIHNLERKLKRFYKFQAQHQGTTVAIRASFVIDDIKAEITNLRRTV